MSDVLNEERKKANFNHQELTNFLYNGEENAKRVLNTFKILSEDPILRNDPADFEKGRIELIKSQALKAKRAHELFGLVDGSEKLIEAISHFGEAFPMAVSIYMFLPYIQYLGTDKQYEKWFPRIRNMEVIGTYAQTELAHGSDVRSLETTATYDPKTDEFIINTPHQLAMKWWPGELGLHANHCICMAQLIIGDKNYGVHGFIVQIRDLETNKPLPGIKIGDIGPKFAWQAKDNGYLIFDNIRIPRENMLMRYSKVNKHGQYSRRGNEKIGYAIMMKIRYWICHGSYQYLAQALTIAIRFSLVRTQFHDDDGNERKLLDYQTQQDKLLPLLAQAFAMNSGAHRTTEMTTENIRLIQEKEDFSMLADVHATLSGVKAFYTQQALDGIGTCRLACGGHGFSSYSGFTSIYLTFSPNCTYEGDNTVMALQTARYLVKCLDKLRKGKEVQETVDYLRNLKEILSIKRCDARKADDFDIETVLDLVKSNAAYMVYVAGSSLMKGVKSLGFKDGWDKKAGLSLIEAARAHIIQFTFRAFLTRINSEVQCPKLKQVLLNLCCLYGVDQILKYPQGVIESSYLEGKQLTMLRERREQLYELIRPYALGLIEGFRYTDNSLKTAIGTYDGKAYENLIEWVNKYNSVNTYDWKQDWEENVKALRTMKPKL